MEQLHIVIMAGGSGTRFWPFSRQSRPKHLLRLFHDRSLLDQTVARSGPLTAPERVWIVTTEPQAGPIRDQLPEIPEENILVEPMGRNTAPCIGLACAMIHERNPDAVAAILPADHRVEPADQFAAQLEDAAAWADRDRRFVTLGIVPTFPATGYGYIEEGEPLDGADTAGPFEVGRFVEKPDEETARTYLEAGTFLWNAGIFVGRADLFLEEIETHLPDLSEGLNQLREALGSGDFERKLHEVYPTLPRISIDYGVMEKTDRAAVMRADFNWDDLGAWTSLAKYLDVDESGNACWGESVTIDASNNIIVAEGDHVIAAAGVSEMIIVHTGDATLVIPKERAQQVKDLVEALRDADHIDHL